MSDSTTVPGLPPAGGPSQRPSAPLPPPPVPDHELLCRIGRGAYGEVWLARSVTGAFRAVKIVHRQSFDHDRPFEREFEGILKFEPISRRHDSQMDILHVGRGQDCFYYVMELADDQATGGQINPEHYTPRTLKSDVLFRSRLPFEECVQIGVALATALQYLHENGLVHRDVKPSNIIFVNGVPKLADIGLVTGVDATRSYVGTEGFAAPEGSGTPEADLYSFGKVLYEISTGKDRQEFPELPTQLRELPDRDGLMELNAVIAKACRHDPKDRYVSAAAMRADLELLQSGKSLARLHRTEAQLRFVRRAGAVVTALAALIAAGWLWQARQTHLVRGLVNEKTRLVAEKTKLADTNARLAEENRKRLVRLDVANGVRLMDADDYSGALLSLAEALRLVTNNPSEESIHRIRIQQILGQSPRLVQVISHEFTNREEVVASSAFSPDGRRIATATAKGNVRIWDSESGRLLVGPQDLGDWPRFLRYSHDGRRLMASSHSEESFMRWGTRNDFAAVLDAATGLELWRRITNAQCVAFSPDDRWLAVGRANFGIEVYDASDGRRILELNGHTNTVTKLTFARDGASLASASLDQTVRLWSVPTGELIGRPINHEQAVDWLAFSQDARRLATAEIDTNSVKTCFVHTWETTTGSEVGPPIPMPRVFGLFFDPATGRRLVVVSTENWTSILDAETHLPVCPRLTLETSVASCVAFSPDGRLIALGGGNNTVRIWDLETGQPATPRLQHRNWITSIHFDPDGRRLLTTSYDGTAKVWDLTALAEGMRQLELDGNIVGYAAPIFPFALSGDGKRLLLSTEENYLRLVDLEKLEEESAPMPSPDGLRMYAISMHDSGHQWASALGGCSIGENKSPWNVGLWREEEGKVRETALQHPESVRFVQFSSDGARVWTWCCDHRLRSWQTADGRLLDQREISGGVAEMLRMSANGEWAVIATQELIPRLFDLRKPGSLDDGAALPGASSGTISAAFSPDGTRLAAVGLDAHLHVWDLHTRQELLPAISPGGALHWTEWSPDGHRLLTAGVLATVGVWDAATGRPAIAPMELGRLCVDVAHYSPDGRFIVARSDDHLVRAWDASNSDPITPILHHGSEVRAAVMTKNNQLVTVSDPAIVRVWDVRESTLPVSVISDYARLADGDTQSSAKLVDLLHALHTNHPSLFTVTDDQLRRWHRQQMPAPRSLALLEAGEFHLQRLAKLSPADPWVKQQQTRFQALRIPPRDPATPTNLLDLTSVYTHSLDMPPDQEFQNLPRGIQEFGGTAFDVRGLIFLEKVESGERPTWGSLSSVSNLLLARRCRQIHFLQATDRENGKEGEEVARWVIHYADGSVREWPVLYGEHVRDWCWSKKDPREARQAVIAWEGKPTPILAVSGNDGVESVRLYKATWINPQPNVEITHLDFVLGKTRLRPFVVAITAE